MQINFKYNFVYYLGHLFLLSVNLAYGCWLLGVEPNFDKVYYQISLLFTLNAVWCIFTWIKIAGDFFDPYLIFLFSAILFNGGHYIANIFAPGENSILVGGGPLCGNFSNPIMLGTSVLVLWGISFFHFGSLNAVLFNKRNRDREGSQTGSNTQTILKKYKYSDQDLRVLGWVLLLFSIVPAILINYQALRVVAMGSYKATHLYRADMGYGSAARILSSLLVPGAFFLLAGNAQRKLPLTISAFIMFFFSLSGFYIGDRSAAIMPLIMYLWLWDHQIGRIPRVLLVLIGVFMLFVVLPMVQVIRLVPGVMRMDPAVLYNILEDLENPILLIVRTMGESMGVIAHTLSLVPDTHDFFFGGTYLKSFLTIIPNVGEGAHVGSDVLGGDWFLSHVLTPKEIEIGRGVGFSFIAEAYINAGYFGVPIILFLFGFGLSKLVLWINNEGGSAKMVLAAIFCSFILQIPRGLFVSCVRPFIWYSLIPFLLVVLVSSWRKTTFGRISYG